jgi:uncharacterized protein DUF4235
MVEEPMIKLLDKPVSILAGALGGVLAGTIFKRIWTLAADEHDAPKATAGRRGRPEVLSAAGAQGAVYAVVTAAVDRGPADGTHKLTSVWPGQNGQQSKEAA